MSQVRVGLVGLLAVGLLAGGARTSWANLLVLDDFDSGKKPNKLGGDFGAWNKDPDDPTQYCRNSFDKTNAYGKIGYSLRLDYDVDSPNPAYNGFWSKLSNVDLRASKQLTFYVKGDPSKGFPDQVKVELKNDRETGRYLVKGISDQWQKVAIPLKEFAGLSDLSKMTEFVIVFDDVTASKRVGTIFVDDIIFE